MDITFDEFKNESKEIQEKYAHHLSDDLDKYASGSIMIGLATLLTRFMALCCMEKKSDPMELWLNMSDLMRAEFFGSINLNYEDKSMANA